MPPVAPGFYPEREAPPQPAADRLLAGLGFRVHNVLARRLAEPAALAEQVRRHAAQFRAGDVQRLLPALRYRLRRDGLRAERIIECFGLFCAALPLGEAQQMPPRVLAAARLLVEGGIAELADAADRPRVLALAACAKAVHGGSVHLLTANERSALSLAERIRGPFAALGIGVGCIAQGAGSDARRRAYARPVVCGAHREIALDYLRDRVQFRGRPGGLRGTLERLSGFAPAPERMLLGGLHCALIEDADLVMLDDAPAPVVIAREADLSQERLLYEQALELARALAPQTDFIVLEDGIRLTDAAARLLGRLTAPLGGIWAARERREELIAASLEALHRLERGVDYQVEQGRVVLPAAPESGTGETAPRDAALLRLLEVKEGCKLGGRREVVARVSVPSFFGRYLHLAGVCGDARGLERDFWSLYGLKTARAGALAVPVELRQRVFVSTERRRAALLETVRARAASGSAVLVAVRSPKEAQAVAQALAAAGIAAGLLRGKGDETERRSLAALDRSGGVAITLHPAERSCEARAAGGVAPLHLVVAELHDARRHVAQIHRVYGAGSGECLLALEDEAVASRIAALGAAARLGAGADGELAAPWSAWVAKLAQRGAERAQAFTRLDLMSRDRYLGDLLAFSGPRE